jgi:hypothetical protein
MNFFEDVKRLWQMLIRIPRTWLQDNINADLVKARYFKMISPLKILQLKLLCNSHLSPCVLHASRPSHPPLFTCHVNFLLVYFLSVNDVFIYKDILKTSSDANHFVILFFPLLFPEKFVRNLPLSASHYFMHELP